MKKTVYVIGHKNPDTDSVCAAVCYADLKNRTDNGDYEYVPRRAGHLNEETQYVLKYFGVRQPVYMKDVSTQISDIEIRKTKGITGDVSIKNAWSAMTEHNVVTLPVLEDTKLRGLITVNHIAKSYMDVYDSDILAKAGTGYSNIVDTLDGRMVAGNITDTVTHGKVVIAAHNSEVMNNYINEGDMIIIGDRFETQLCALEQKAGCIVICENAMPDEKVIDGAKETNCHIIVTPYDAYTASRLINQSIPVRYFMLDDDLIYFRINDTLDNIRETMTKTRHRDFPVLDDDDNYVGMISRRNILGANRKNVILVDHNERGQAPNGIEEATILEIIDHHRLGTIETMAPVFFRNQPLGSTSTIIYMMYKENGIVPDKCHAGLMCAAILSDTLIFRSPTCTDTDIEAANELAEIAGIDALSFGRNMFKAGSNLAAKKTKDIVYSDYKKFTIGDLSFGIGQVNVMGIDEIEDLRPRVIAYLKTEIPADDIVIFMLTNIMTESSEIICSNAKAVDMIEDAFNLKFDGESVLLKGVVSRKKQLVPAIFDGLQQ